MCVFFVEMVVCMLWLRFSYMCRCYGMSSAYEVSYSGAGGCGMSDMYMLTNVGERTRLEGCQF